VSQSPARGEELDPLLRPIVAYHTPIEALSKDIQHRPVFTENLGYEMRDPTLLGDDRQLFDEDRPEAAAVEMIGDLDRDFRPRAIQLDIQGVSDHRPHLVMGNQPEATRAGVRRQMSSTAYVHGAAEEPQTPRLQAQSRQERAQRGLIGGRGGTQRDQRAIAQPDKLGLVDICDGAGCL